FNLTPFAAVQYSHLWQQGFTETASSGAGLFALTFAEKSQSSAPVFLGAQLDTQYAAGGMMLAPYLRAAWVHEFIPDRSITSALVSVPASAFTVDGARPSSNSIKIDLGTKLAIGMSTSVFANVSSESELFSHGRTLAGMAGAKYTW